MSDYNSLNLRTKTSDLFHLSLIIFSLVLNLKAQGQREVNLKKASITLNQNL